MELIVFILFALVGVFIMEYGSRASPYHRDFPYLDKIINHLRCGNDELYSAILKVAKHVEYPHTINGCDRRAASMRKLNYWIKENWRDEWL